MRLGTVYFLYVLALLALVTVLTQAPSAQPWIGTLEFRDSRGLTVGRVTAQITITAGAVTGDWRSRGGASGSITGTIDDKGRIKATFIAFGGAQFDNGKAVPERCHGEATAEGQLHSGDVLRLTVSRLRLDTPKQRARERPCEDLSRVVLLLQPAH